MIFKRPMSKNALFGPQNSHQIWCFCCSFWTSFWAPSRRNFAAPFLWICFKHYAFLMILRQPKNRYLFTFGSESRPAKLTYFLLFFYPSIPSHHEYALKSYVFFNDFLFLWTPLRSSAGPPQGWKCNKKQWIFNDFQIIGGQIFIFFMKLLLLSRTSAKRWNSGAISIVKTIRL